jgi:lipopolysaccharide/colanic/teichoic acid biosynthesis glycosyltransferase
MPTTVKEAVAHRLTFVTPSSVPRANIRAKRMLDLMLGIPIALLASPLLILIWVSYKLSGLVFPEDRGPVFRQVYRHAYGRVILVYKVRVPKMEAIAACSTTIKDADVARLNQLLDEGTSRSVNRSRYCLVEDFGLDCTWFGNLIKAMYLDELPQILNVVKGDMSFVGPRPFGLRDNRTCPDQDGLVTLGGERFDYRHRDLLPGGLTGLYQANKSAAAKTDRGTFVREGVALDRQYYEQLLRATPWQVVKTDLSVICRTIPVVLRHEGI